MSSANGDGGNNAGCQSGLSTGWSGSSTPPDVYGNFSRPGLADDMMDAVEVERTAEDLTPPTDIRNAHVVRQSLHNHLAELEESGEYDIRALAPLRHLLDQDWTDPNVRSRLKAKVEAEDARTAQATPNSGKAPAKEWFTTLAESPATAETVQVPAITETPRAATPAAASVSPAAASGSAAGQSATTAQPSPPATHPAQPNPLAAATTRPPNPAAAALRPLAPAGPPPTAARPQAAVNSAKPSAPPSQGPAGPLRPRPEPADTPQVLSGRSETLVFDDDQEKTGPSKARSRALKLLSTVPTREEEKRKVRPWILAAGALLVATALAVPTSAFTGDAAALAPPTFVLTSEPKAEVFLGQERLGETPMLMRAEQVGDGLTLQREGFEPQTFALDKPLSQNRVERRQVVLNVAPVALDWTGLPANSKVMWQGKPATTESLATAMPGTYSLKVTAPDRPAVTVSVVVPAPGSGAPARVVTPGQQVAAALSQQPALSVTIKTGKAKGAKLPLAVSVSQKGGGKFSQTASLDGKAASKIVLPGPGTYQIKVPASPTHQAFSKTVTAKAGASQALEIALTPVPPKVAVAQAPSAGGGYAPEPVYYAPAPVYYSGGGGGGGGGGRIAPPSF